MRSVVHPDDLGARVRAARSYADLSQQALADAIGVERRIIGYIEGNEDRHELTVLEAQKIATVTGVPISFLLHGWDGQGLNERVGRLEDAVRLAEQDRNRLAEEIDHIYATIESRFADVASQRLAQGRAPRTAADRRSGADRRAP